MATAVVAARSCSASLTSQPTKSRCTTPSTASPSGASTSGASDAGQAHDPGWHVLDSPCRLVTQTPAVRLPGQVRKCTPSVSALGQPVDRRQSVCNIDFSSFGAQSGARRAAGDLPVYLLPLPMGANDADAQADVCGVEGGGAAAEVRRRVERSAGTPLAEHPEESFPLDLVTWKSTRAGGRPHKDYCSWSE